jgi:hypothetical protein
VALAAEAVSYWGKAAYFNWGLAKALGRNMIHLTPLTINTVPISAGLNGAYYTDMNTMMQDQVFNFLNFLPDTNMTL